MRKGIYLLCADIGGTNTNLSIVEIVRKKPKLVLIEHEKTKTKKALFDFFTKFLNKAKNKGYEIIGASIAAAGPVEKTRNGQKIKMTNSKILIDSHEFKKKLLLDDVILINDFEAISFAINVIPKKDVKVLNKGNPVKNGTKAVIGAGTGLGESILYYDESLGCYIPEPSEGGHSDLVVFGDEEEELAHFIQKKLKRKYLPEKEDILSGRGIELIYEHYSKKYPKMPKKLSAMDISKTRMTNPCSKMTYSIFLKFYARRCRNLALESLSSSGIYIAGGIAAGNPGAFQKSFVSRFLRNQRFSKILKKTPLYLLKNYDISHLGSAYAFYIKKIKS